MSRSTPPKPRPRARARAVAPVVGDTRARLLATARDLFLEQGASAFSLREVARRVGISAAAVYRHFEDKDALLYAACTQGFQVFFSYLVRALAAPTPAERLVASGEQYRAFAVENPLDYRFMFMTPAAQIGPPSKRKPRLPAPAGAPPQEATFRFLVDRVQRVHVGGCVGPGRPGARRRRDLVARARAGLVAPGGPLGCARGRGSVQPILPTVDGTPGAVAGELVFFGQQVNSVHSRRRMP